MGVGSKLPLFLAAPLVEWRAQQISDPVEKLRFLRQSMGDRWTGGPGVSRRSAQGLVVAACVIGICLFIPWRTASTTSAQRAPVQPVVQPAVLAEPQPVDLPPLKTSDRVQKVWLVDTKNGEEVYSNGLRIEDTYRTQNQWRFYQVYDRQHDNAPATKWRSEPAGIVFHTTESHMTPFEENHTVRMKRIGAELLKFIRENHSYHFVIDRFGRVFRVVQESDAANHAGNSVWADKRWVYLGLNNSFLGIAFEAQTAEADQSSSVTPAQIHAGRVLTQMLRSKYGIAAGNCVTHAQVSVNPSNMQVGYHTDWAGNFPFRELDLADNYEEPLPSIFTFGFEYNSSFVKLTGARMWRGLNAAEQQLKQQAALQGMALPEYRATLQQQYKKLLAASKMDNGAGKEKNSGAD